MNALPLMLGVAAIGLLSGRIPASASSPLPVPAALRVSVYATAGDVSRHLADPGVRRSTVDRLAALGVARVFVEGRRGDEVVSVPVLREVREFLASAGIEAAGGIATVPGAGFGTRQVGPLGWLNWESPKTRADVAGFFRDNAPVFDTLIVDDFFCTGDVSEASEQARMRAGQDWGGYRRDLLVSLLEPLVFGPTRAAVSPPPRMIIKFPQWYDLFHRYGYAPERMAVSFDAVWVGTEVRNPETRRMGFVPPTEGYINFRWITEVTGGKTVGAWFDHIECTPRNFVDQAYQSVLAGARELTLFHLGDVMEPHPGDALFAEHLGALRELAARVQSRSLQRRGLPYYKPPDSEAEDNVYLMDQLAMVGIPVLPVARYPRGAGAVFLGAQAAGAPGIEGEVADGLAEGATIFVTPAFVRRAGPWAAARAGVEVAAAAVPEFADGVLIRGRREALERPLAVEGSVRVGAARVLMEATAGQLRRPWVTRHRVGRGAVVMLNVRTFSEQDFLEAGEWLLAPRPAGLSVLPAAVADPLRRLLLEPVGLRFAAPAGVSLVAFADACCVVNFLPRPVEVRLQGRALPLRAHECRWVERAGDKARSR